MIIWIRNQSTGMEFEYVDFSEVTPSDAHIGRAIRYAIYTAKTLTESIGKVHTVVVTE